MKFQKGFTLVELLVTLAIIAILVGVVFPGFQGMLARNSMVTSANSMVLAMSFARGEAVRVGGGVQIVALNPADGANEWGPGWQVLDSDNSVLRQFEPVGTGLTFDAPAGVTAITFTSRGAVQGGVGVDLNLCNAEGSGAGGDLGVVVSVSAIGRASTRTATAGDCP